MSFCRIGIVGLLFAIPLFSNVSAFGAEKPLRFAPLPMEGRKILHEQFFGLLHYLQQEFGRPIEMVDLLDYEALLKAFRSDEIDLVYLGPLSYALLAKTDKDVEPVACFREPDGQVRFTCSLVTAGEYQPDLLQDQALHIGLTHPFSTCGYLAVSQMLQAAGRRLDEPDIRFSYAGSHTEAVLGVVRGDFDLAGVKTEIAERYSHLDLKSVAVSRTFPGYGIYANLRQLQVQEVERLRQALLRLDLDNLERNRDLMKGWGRSLSSGVVKPFHCNNRGMLDSVGVLPSLSGGLY
jgi:phosphonate transport system substrate-binding protein